MWNLLNPSTCPLVGRWYAVAARGIVSKSGISSRRTYYSTGFVLCLHIFRYFIRRSQWSINSYAICNEVILDVDISFVFSRNYRFLQARRSFCSMSSPVSPLCSLQRITMSPLPGTSDLIAVVRRMTYFEHIRHNLWGSCTAHCPCVVSTKLFASCRIYVCCPVDPPMSEGATHIAMSA